MAYHQPLAHRGVHKITVPTPGVWKRRFPSEVGEYELGENVGHPQQDDEAVHEGYGDGQPLAPPQGDHVDDARQGEYVHQTRQGTTVP